MRRLLLGVALLATLVALFYTEEDVRGWHAWKEHVREHAAKGEKLDAADFMPPAVPDDQNFCQCPLLKPILQVRMVNGQGVWSDTNGWARVQALRSRLTPSSAPDITNGLVGWQAYYRSLTNLAGLSLTNSPAEDVRLVLRRFDPELAELKREAASRPLDRWAIRYDYESPWDIPFPHLAQVKTICDLLRLRATASLAAGDAAGALSDLQLGFRLANSVRAEPFLISQAVRAASCNLLLEPLREGLQRHQFSEAQLLALQRELASDDLLSPWELAARAERSLQGTWTKAGMKSFFEWAGEFGLGPDARPFTTFARYIRFVPQGWVYQNRVGVCRRFDECLVPAVDIAARVVHRPGARALAKPGSAPGSMLVLFFYQIDRRIFGDGCHGLTRVAYAQTQIDAACVACALERYRLAQGKYPESVAALEPKFIDKLPHDVMNGGPIHYRLTSEGNFILYSVGWNGTDEGGVVAQYHDESQGGAPVRLREVKIDLEQGDWVWP